MSNINVLSNIVTNGNGWNLTGDDDNEEVQEAEDEENETKDMLQCLTADK